MAVIRLTVRGHKPGDSLLFLNARGISPGRRPSGKPFPYYWTTRNRQSRSDGMPAACTERIVGVRTDAAYGARESFPDVLFSFSELARTAQYIIYGLRPVWLAVLQFIYDIITARLVRYRWSRIYLVLFAYVALVRNIYI